MNFSPDSKFTAMCVRLVQLTKINLLWLLCSLPLFTVGASTAAIQISQSDNEIATVL